MTEKRILLIEPPFHRLYKSTYSLDLYPLGLGYLAGTIKKETDWDVKVYNADFTPHGERQSLAYMAGSGFYKYLDNLKNPFAQIWNEVKMAIREFKPIVIGISAKSQNYKSACMIAKIAKEIDRNIIVIVGGPHPSMAGKDVLTCPDIDICVKGEGEKTIVELLEVIGRNGKPENVRGVIYKTNGIVIENAAQEYIQNLDKLCFPAENARELLKDYNLYPREAFKHIFATRGCPGNCIFCGSRNIWSRRVRFRSPDNVAREMKYCQEIGLRSVSFEDDYFGITKKYVFDLCDAIMKECPGIKWSCEIHVNLIDDEVIKMMKKAGCFSIRLGIESGNNDILKKIRKNITIEEALSACKIVKKHGIELQVFYMIGFPQETDKTLMDTFEVINKNRCDVLIYSIFTPYPGTEAFELCKEQGTIKNDYDLALYNHQSPLNYFCPAITKDKFRAIAVKIEHAIDRKNRFNRIKRVFSVNVIWQIKEKGIWRSLHKGVKTIMGR